MRLGSRTWKVPSMSYDKLQNKKGDHHRALPLNIVAHWPACSVSTPAPPRSKQTDNPLIHSRKNPSLVRLLQNGQTRESIFELRLVRPVPDDFEFGRATPSFTFGLFAPVCGRTHACGTLSRAARLLMVHLENRRAPVAADWIH